MPPSGEKPRKSEPQQAVIQPGEVGFYPLNSLGISALHFGQAHTAIGFREEAFAEKLRTQSELVVGNETLAIGGKVYAGICDAFYRGKLPELLVVTTSMMEIPLFIEEFMDFLEKLCTLGFLSYQDSDEMTLLDKYVPLVVIAAYGVVYDVVMQKFEESLDNLSNISLRQRERLMQKFSRGFFITPPEGYDLALNPLTLYSAPLVLNLAGSKSLYTVRGSQLAEAARLLGQFNPNGEQGILEWEMNLAYRHLAHRLLPLLASRHKTLTYSPEDTRDLMESLGQSLGILPGLVTLDDKKPWQAPLNSLTISTADLAILHQLKVLALRCQLSAVQTWLDWLLEAVRPLAGSSGSASSVAAGEAH